MFFWVLLGLALALFFPIKENGFFVCFFIPIISPGKKFKKFCPAGTIILKYYSISAFLNSILAHYMGIFKKRLYHLVGFFEHLVGFFEHLVGFFEHLVGF